MSDASTPAPTAEPVRLPPAVAAQPAPSAPTLGATAVGNPAAGSAAEAFSTWRARVHSWLPARLRRIVPPTAIGFAVLSSLTYAIDLALLSVLFDGLGVPYPVAVTVGYVVAFSLSFLLNRWLNFQSHGSVSRQSGRFVLTVVANYVLFILALSTTLEALGVNYFVARLAAGACEAVFMYVMMRAYIFRQSRR